MEIQYAHQVLLIDFCLVVLFVQLEKEFSLELNFQKLFSFFFPFKYHIPPAALGALFLFASRLKADPVLNASSKLSITPSWSPGPLKSTRAFLLAAR